MYSTTLLQHYNQLVQKGDLIADPANERVIKNLQCVYTNITARQAGRWRRLFSHKYRPVKGLYLWGSVGVGKTMLMDLFFDSLPIERKSRYHFHAFMQEVHEELNRLQGRDDPLTTIAREFSLRCEVLCFDEFFVNDITDASILGRLLKTLFDRGVCVVMTSNTAPENLYLHGLQRQRFLKTIDLICRHCEVVHMQSEMDYRMRNLQRAGVYFTPLGDAANESLITCFGYFVPWETGVCEPITIANRPIAIIRRAASIIWFDFNVICNTPRCKVDYLEIVKRYSTIIISNVPNLTTASLDQLTYFIQLIDILYDNKTKLILSAAVPVKELYPIGEKRHEFARTESRLIEMQTNEYLKT